MMSKLFPLDQVQILIDVIFQEMQNATKRLSDKNKENFKLKRDLGNNTLESLKKFLTEYFAYCEKNKYLALQYLMHTMVNDTSKKIRIPFLEEILEGTNQIQQSLAYMRSLILIDDQNYKAWVEKCNDDDGNQNAAGDPYYCQTLCQKIKLDLELER